MKRLTLALALLSLSACATAPKPQGYTLPPALAEIYRNGELKPLQEPSGLDLGAPIADEQVSHTCISSPQFDLVGRYRGTRVRCW